MISQRRNKEQRGGLVRPPLLHPFRTLVDVDQCGDSACSSRLKGDVDIPPPPPPGGWR